jgi:hypothetical protein
MSCYAFFKRWLPLSQLINNYQIYSNKNIYIFYYLINPFSLNFYFRTLANDLGCFPFDLEPSRTKSVYI